jgi:hypothetical protein
MGWGRGPGGGVEGGTLDGLWVQYDVPCCSSIDQQ